MLYCLHLLEETGLHVRPGCEYGQRKDSHHIRFVRATVVSYCMYVNGNLTQNTQNHAGKCEFVNYCQLVLPQ